MKKLAIIVIAVLALTGCSTPIGDPTQGVIIAWQDLPDGGRVLCATLYSGAITCDWEHVDD